MEGRFETIAHDCRDATTARTSNSDVGTSNVAVDHTRRRRHQRPLKRLAVNSDGEPIAAINTLDQASKRPTEASHLYRVSVKQPPGD
jgi:hypothetical protein